MQREIGTTVQLSFQLMEMGIALSGQIPTVAVRRCADDFWLDWDDVTFKNAGWTLRDAPMTELSESPGTYARAFTPGTAIASPGEYAAHYIYDDGSDLYEVVDAETWGRVMLAVKTLVNKMVVNGTTSKLIVYEADGVTVAKEWDVDDKDGNNVVLTGTGPARRGVPS